MKPPSRSMEGRGFIYQQSVCWQHHLKRGYLQSICLPQRRPHPSFHRRRHRYNIHIRSDNSNMGDDSVCDNRCGGGGGGSGVGVRDTRRVGDRGTLCGDVDDSSDRCDNIHILGCNNTLGYSTHHRCFHHCNNSYHRLHRCRHVRIQVRGLPQVPLRR